MIRNVVVHIANEQPLLADLYEMPNASDVSMICTNVRMLDGKRPLFVDNSDSVFAFPYLHIRFVEILPGSVTGMPETDIAMPDVAALDGGGDDGGDDGDVDLELDEDFLRRIRDV